MHWYQIQVFRIGRGADVQYGMFAGIALFLMIVTLTWFFVHDSERLSRSFKNEDYEFRKNLITYYESYEASRAKNIAECKNKGKEAGIDMSVFCDSLYYPLDSISEFLASYGL